MDLIIKSGIMKQLKLVLVLVVILSTAAVRASGQADETMPRDLFYDKIAPTERKLFLMIM